MKGSILIENYRFACIIGVYPRERTQEQELLLSVTLTFEMNMQDDLSQTIDYDEVAKICCELACTKKFQLLETFAGEAIELLFKRYTLLSAKIKVMKTTGFGVEVWR